MSISIQFLQPDTGLESVKMAQYATTAPRTVPEPAGREGASATFLIADDEALLSMSHLDRHTFSDAALQLEVLKVFHEQLTICEQGIEGASGLARQRLAHQMKGSASGVGALFLAERMALLEDDPDAHAIVKSCLKALKDTRGRIERVMQNLS